MQSSKRSFGQWLWDYVVVTFAGILNAVSMFTFVNPSNLIAGGFSGLASSVTHLLVLFVPNVQFESTMSVVYFLINIPLLTCSLIFLRGDFTFKTIWATIVCTVFLGFLPVEFQFHGSRLVAAIVGGVTIGVSMYIATIHNGSNGGTEIIAKIISNKNPEIDISNVLSVANIILSASGSLLLVFLQGESVWTIVYSLVYVISGVTMLGILGRGLDHPQKFIICTNNAGQLAQAIVDEFGRGLQIVDMHDCYPCHPDNKMIVVVVQYRQSSRLKRLIRYYDPSAFSFVKDVHDVFSRPNFNRSYKTK